MVKSQKSQKLNRKKNTTRKSFTIPFDVAILILVSVLIFIMFTIAYRSCSKDDNQLEKLKVNIETKITGFQPEGELL